MSTKINMLARRGGDVPLRRVLVVSLKNYGTLTVLDRAIPDYRDGLKPVQRRVLWALYRAGALSGRAFKKKANIVGDTMKYHPHGDAPISDAMTTMVHDRYPLVEGYGSWGDPVFNEPAGAMRYIECRLSKLGDTLFERLPVTDMVRNYSGEYDEPLILHAPLPLFLLNGSSGIAVGVSFNVPPHNLTEVVNLLKAYLDRGDALTVEEIVDRGLLKGPDYPFGGVLTSSREDLIAFYRTGRGALTFRCRYHFDPENNVLVITSAAPHVNLGKLKEKLEALVEQGLLDFVRDDSRDDIRILVGYSNPHVVKTRVLPLLRSTVHFRMCLTERLNEEDAVFRETNLLDFVRRWVDYRRRVERRFLEYQRQKVEAKIREAELTQKVVRHLDDVVKAVRAKDPVAALKRLLKVTDEEAQAVLRKPLSAFTRSSVAALQERLKELRAQHRDLTRRLRDVDGEIKRQLDELARRFSDARRTVAWDEAEARHEPEPPATAATASGYLVLRFDQAKLTLEAKPGRAKADAVVRPEYPFLIVTPEGRGRVLRYPNVQHLASYKRRLAAAVPLVPGRWVTLLDDQGRVLVFKADALAEAGPRERAVFKTKGRVVAGTVVGPDQFLVLHRPRSHKVLGPEELEEIAARPGQAGRAVAANAQGLAVVDAFEEDEGRVTRDDALLLFANGTRRRGPWQGPLAGAPVLVLTD